MVSRSPHCDANRLQRFIDDQLTSEEASQVEDHVGGCIACRSRLESIVANPSWWSNAQQLLTGSNLAHDQNTSGLYAADHFDRSPNDDVPSLEFLAPTDDPEKLGRLGPYEVSGVIGQGGMGIVLKGFDTALDRSVAIKVLAPPLAATGAARQRFAREVRAAAAVDHQHVVAIHAVDSAGSLPYFVMPLIRGESLQRRIDRSGPLDLKATLRIGMQIAAGLAAAHAQGVVHRDIKPANILLEDGVERVKITDFGLARAIDDASVTRSGVIAGTPQYMSPEQAEGRSVDHRTDIFSLGCVIYAMCTGRSPFRAETTLAVLRRICEDTPRPVRDVNPDVPSWLQQVVNKLLAKEPAERFQSASEVVELLSHCLAHVQRPAAVALTSELFMDLETESCSGCKRRPLRIVAAAGLVLTVGVVAMLIGTWQSQWKPASDDVIGSAGRENVTSPAPPPHAAIRVDRSSDALATDAAIQKDMTRTPLHDAWESWDGRLPMISAEVGAMLEENLLGPAADSRSQDEVLTDIESGLETVKREIEQDWP